MITHNATNTRRIWVLFGLVLALFLSLSAVQQHQQSVLHQQQREIARAAYDSCVGRNDNVAKLNATFEGLARIEATNRFIDDSVRVPRMQVYRDAKFLILDCGVRP